MSTSDAFGTGTPNPEPEDHERFEYKDVRAVRGMESRTIAKWEGEGWELIGREAGPVLRTNMRFRRIWPKTLSAWTAQKVAAFKRLPLGQQLRYGAIAAGAFVAVIIIAGVAGSLGGGGDEDPVAKKPAAATATSAKPTPKATTQPTPKATTPKPKPVPDNADSDETMTVKNSPALRKLLSTDDDDVAAKFASKYQGRTIQFDGNIADQAHHGDYDTRFDYLAYAGDFPAAPGPAFQFRDQNIFDMNSDGQAILPGADCRFVAEVVEFDESQSLFLLSPVSTRRR